MNARHPLIVGERAPEPWPYVTLPDGLAPSPVGLTEIKGLQHPGSLAGLVTNLGKRFACRFGWKASANG